MKNNRRSHKKKPSEDDLVRMTRAAEMYYREERLYKEIGDSLGCSPTEVGRLLKEAAEHKIVEIKINPQHRPKIKESLMNRYKQLRDIRISPTFPDPEKTREALANEGAKFFDEIVIRDNITSPLTVGISGGRTIHRMIESVKSKPRHIRILPLTGIWRDLQINYVDSGALVHSLWAKCKDMADAFWFPIEPLTGDSKSGRVSERRKAVLELRKGYLKNRQIREVYEEANNVDLALIGVGPVRQLSATIQQLSSIHITYEYLTSRGAIGIAGGVWYDKNAKAVVPDFFLSVPLSSFQRLSRKKTKRVVIVAGGKDKVDAIEVLLKHRVCNVLITDSQTASLLFTRLSEN